MRLNALGCLAASRLGCVLLALAAAGEGFGYEGGGGEDGEGDKEI